MTAHFTEAVVAHPRAQAARGCSDKSMRDALCSVDRADPFALESACSARPRHVQMTRRIGFTCPC